MVDKKFIKNLQGRDFVLFEGLLDEAHKQGLTGIDSLMVSGTEEATVIFQAIVTLKNKDGERKFTAHGDANDTNVSTAVKAHKIRMAETRAIARALRFATNIGMCSVEELGDSKKDKLQTTKPITTLICSNEKCQKPIDKKVSDYSIKYWGKQLCLVCQKVQMKKEEEQRG